MSTSDQHDHGPLTRKQLREIRLTGSTPVITPEEAAAAAEAAPPAPPVPSEAKPVEETPAPAAEEAAPVAADDSTDVAAGAPLTRRQVREQERTRIGSVSVIGADDDETRSDVEESAASEEAPAVDDTTAADDSPVDDASVEEPPVLVSGLPDFTAHPGTAPADTAGDDDDIDDEIVLEPVPASEPADSVRVVPLEVTEESADPDSRDDDVADVLGLTSETEPGVDPAEDDVLADVHEADDDDVVDDPRPTVNPGFGEGLLTDASEADAPAAFRPSFDELLTVGDSTGSQHSAPNALIFTPSPGDGSLSGPVASTGEILVTGSYELPRGLGSQGHAHGTTDGKDIDAVLIDGELAPSSSPTPIAASAAVSTIKPAGEVIRPPAPEKGNRLLLILAIVAGGLALAVGTAVIVAFSTNVF